MRVDVIARRNIFAGVSNHLCILQDGIALFDSLRSHFVAARYILAGRNTFAIGSRVKRVDSVNDIIGRVEANS
jgi:hypothetical protein